MLILRGGSGWVLPVEPPPPQRSRGRTGDTSLTLGGGSLDSSTKDWKKSRIFVLGKRNVHLKNNNTTKKTALYYIVYSYKKFRALLHSNRKEKSIEVQQASRKLIIDSWKNNRNENGVRIFKLQMLCKKISNRNLKK